MPLRVAVTAEQLTDLSRERKDDKRRGLNIYSTADLVGVTGTTKEGDYVTAQTDQPYFDLSIEERIEIFRKTSPVFGVVTSRMQRISGIDFEIVPDNKNEDRIVDEIRFNKMIYKELEGREELKYVTVRATVYNELLQTLPELLPDLSNFEPSLMRWKKRIQYAKLDRANEIKDWLEQPNINYNWTEFVKLWIFDLMIHGSNCIYKEEIGEVIENIYMLPGGSCIPLKSKFVGSLDAYVQFTETYEAQIFFGNEVSFTNYIPTTARAYGMIPLESLTNKVAESLLFDKLMAEQADGTKAPEKLVIFGEKSPFGDFDKAGDVPLDKDEQTRIETALNEERKYAVKLLTGHGQPVVVDLTRENTMGIQMERQKMIREEVALVFNMSNMEVNLTGSEDTSGRSTSEEQGKIDFGKGIAPLMMIIEKGVSKEILPFRFGGGYRYQYKQSADDLAEIAKWQKMLDSGLFSVNEIRTQEMNKTPFMGEEFDFPKGVQPQTPGLGELDQFLQGAVSAGRESSINK